MDRFGRTEEKQWKGKAGNYWRWYSAWECSCRYSTELSLQKERMCKMIYKLLNLQRKQTQKTASQQMHRRVHSSRGAWRKMPDRRNRRCWWTRGHPEYRTGQFPRTIGKHIAAAIGSRECKEQPFESSESAKKQQHFDNGWGIFPGGNGIRRWSYPGKGHCIK